MEQSFFESLFSKKIKSHSNAQKILKVSFVICAIPIMLIAFVHLFFPDIFSESIASDQITIIIAYVFGLVMFLLGWLIFKEYSWAAYISIVIFIGPNILEAIVGKSFPSFSLLDMCLVIFMVASIRSIKCLKQENAK